LAGLIANDPPLVIASVITIIIITNEPNVTCKMRSSHHAEGLVNPKVRALKKGY
jgi:hypothetical protein